MKRVIFTTIQYNLDAIKMLEVALKSFYRFNKGFDFKVYCLDNSKDKFEEYFNKFNFENLEFINFRDNTKWLDFVNSDKNTFKNIDDIFTFDTSVCISKLEIVDILLKEYDLVIMSDIDIIYTDSIDRCFPDFIKSGKFMAGKCDCHFLDDFCLNAGFVIFNKKSTDFVENIFDKFTEIKDDLVSKAYKREYRYAEQDKLSLITCSKFELKNISCPIIDSDRYVVYNPVLIHFAGKEFKPSSDKVEKIEFQYDKIRFAHSFYEYKLFYKRICELLNVDIDVKLVIVNNPGTYFLKKNIHKYLEKIYEKF